jgi:hypothetical protein
MSFSDNPVEYKSIELIGINGLSDETPSGIFPCAANVRSLFSVSIDRRQKTYRASPAAAEH